VKRRGWLMVGIAAMGLAGASAVLWRQARVEGHFAPQFEAAAHRYTVDPLLVRAVIWRESRFNPNARGSRGEIGLMQIQDNAAREWADAERIVAFDHAHCYDPVTNTLAGTFYLSRLLKRYAATDNPVPYALADYNAGRGNVLRWKAGVAVTNSAAFVRAIGFPGTKRYVQSVMWRYALYQFLSRLGLS
jgi:soluble lytic murein transglycosylase